jgi:hypothetical protein
MALRTRNAAVLAKIEGTVGTDASPVAGSDAVLVENVSFGFNVNLVNTNEVTGSLDPRAPIVGGMIATVSFDVYLKGAGSAGTAPEWGKLLRACGWAETLTSTAVPASAEACAAGGSTTTAVLGTSAAGTAQIYRGMPVVFTGAVAGTSFITDYTAGKAATLTDTLGGSIVATTNYQIPVNVRYSPASTSIPSLTIHVFMDGLRYRFTGCRGTATLELQSGGPGRLRFNFTGRVTDKSDQSVPTGLVYDSTRPPIWRGGAALMNRTAVGISSMSLNFGNAIVNPDNPNDAEAYDPTEIVSRNMQGSVSRQEYLVATADAFADFRAGTQRIIHARYGGTAGNRIGVTLPAAQYTNQNPTDQSGVMSVALPFAATGQDAGAFIALY